MRRLLKLVIVLAVLWSGYWYVASVGLRGGIEGWFAEQRARGWQADYAGLEISGYPLRHMTRIDAPALADPNSGTAWRADWVAFDSPAIWPGKQTLSFAATPQRLSYFDQTAEVVADGLSADLHLRPGVALELDRMALTSGPWRVNTPTGAVVQARSLTLSMDQAERPEIYDFVIEAQAFSPGDDLRRLLGTDSSLPRDFDMLELDMSVRFDKTWDRSALEDRRPQPRHLDLRLAEMRWGPLRLFATGTLDVDEQGIPTGKIAFQAENWRDMLAMAQTAGAIPESAVEPATRVLGMLAGLGGNPRTLDAQVNFRDGFVAFGPIPLGPAPRLIIR